MGPGDYGMNGIVNLAMVGMVALGILALALVIGTPIGIWWLFHHIQFV